MKCGNCGRECEAGANFCRACGTRLSGGTDMTAAKKQSYGSVVIIAAVAVVVVIAAFFLRNIAEYQQAKNELQDHLTSAPSWMDYDNGISTYISFTQNTVRVRKLKGMYHVEIMDETYSYQCIDAMTVEIDGEEYTVECRMFGDECDMLTFSPDFADGSKFVKIYA